MTADIHDTEIRRVADLRPHPRNYRFHPDSQIEHLMASVEQFGIYRNVVVAEDDTILAGHGVVEALTRMGRDEVPVIAMPFGPDDPRALKILAADNWLSYFSEDDDRALTEMLKELADDGELVGTGFDEMQLAAMLLATRPRSEIEGIDEAAEWVGMPEYEPGGVDGRRPPGLYVNFDTAEEREAFIQELGADEFVVRGSIVTWSLAWPLRKRADRKSVLIEG
jgi:hypothetical protein